MVGQCAEWTDGVSARITKIKGGRVTAEHVDRNSDLKVGQAYTIITVKITNGSAQRIDLLTEALVSYGPDGEGAIETYLSEDTEARAPDGVLLPNRSKSGFFVFLIPERYQDNVVVELTPDLDHDAVVFTGSIEK